jgi:hypothetical protein
VSRTATEPPRPPPSSSNAGTTCAGGPGPAGAENATLAAALPHLVHEPARLDNHSLRLRPNLTNAQLRAAIDTAATAELPAPEVTDEATRELKFGETLPQSSPPPPSPYDSPTSPRHAPCSASACSGRK